jgi:hypothetical protein
MTIEQFRGNEVMVTSFASLLKTNEFQVALAIVRELGIPRETGAPAGATFAEWNSHQNTRREGFHLALDSLLALGTPTPKRRNDRDLMPSLSKED